MPVTADNSYIWDATNGQVSLAVRRPNGAMATGGAVASMSSDGRFVAYTSPADEGTSAQTDVYLWDRATRTRVLVSHAAGNPSQPANGPSDASVMTEDGAFVTFVSN